jgi:cyclopropane fatty-acyl-phospholipid synthase-like methyltransferase
MKTKVKSLLNPVKIYKAYRFQKQFVKTTRTRKDLELMLYSKILKNKMLHLGYFEDPEIQPEDISINQIEQAQMNYAQLLVDLVKDYDNPILDVGCGMGGLSKMLIGKNLKVEALTPDKNQIQFIKQNIPELNCHHMKYEELETEKKFGTIINSESLQYIKLDDAFQKSNSLLLDNGYWIIIDYFRLKENTINKSGHFLSEFLTKVEEYDYEILHEQDVTPNILPTLKYLYMYVDRFSNPLLEYGTEKLKYKKPWIFHLTQDLRESINLKINKEVAAINPKLFGEEKKYALYLLRKK